MAKLKNQFKIRRCIFVGDRGIISKENLEVLEKDEDYKDFESILALKKRRNKEVKEIMSGKKPLIYCRLKDNLEYREVAGKEGLRFIVCRNPEIAEQQRKDRNEKMQDIKKALDELKTKIASCKHPSLKRIVQLVEGVLSRPKDRRLYGYKLNEKKRNFERMSR